MQSDPVLESVRRQITQRVAELRREISRDRAELDDLRQRVGSHDVLDPAERAGDAAVADVLGPAEEILLREALQLEAALHRIADGHYGVCVDCHKAIAPQRLAAEPACERCLSCQTAFERAPGRR